MKILTPVVALVLLSFSAHSQGTLVFNNDAGSLVKRATSYNDDTPITLASGYVQLLFAAPGTQPGVIMIGEGLPIGSWLGYNPGWKLGPASSVEGGLFQGGQVALVGFQPGTEVSYLIFAWAGPPTWDEAIREDLAWWGTTILAPGEQILTLGGEGIPAASLADTFDGVMLYSSRFIPEPSSAALAGVGCLAWWWRRRRE